MSTTTRDANAPPRPDMLSDAQIREWVEYEVAALIRRRDEDLLPALRGMLREDGTASIPDEEVAGIFVENTTMARALIRSGDERHARLKAPFLSGGRVVDAWKREFVAPIETALAPLHQAQLEYANRKAEVERKRREEAAEVARIEAARRAEEAAKLLASRPASAATEKAMDDMAAAARRADVAETKAAAPTSELSRSRGVFGGTASVRTRWGWKLADISKVPAEFLSVNVDAVREASKRRDPQTNRPTAVIPGIEWVEERSVGSARITS